jgi:hypothetical protein
MGAMFEPLHYPHESPGTESLGRLRGDGWSVFVKVVRSFRHWPRYPLLPAEVRKAFDEPGAWRHEVELYRSGLGRLLPPGMRLPHVYGVVELPDDRVLLVLEDIAVDPSPWTTDRYARAACRLGRLHVRLSRATELPRRGSERPSELLHALHRSRLVPVALPQLVDEETWRHPLLRHAQHLRADLVELARRLPSLIERVTALPQLLAHGDASPQNLLVPLDEPDTFVVIDWAMTAVAAAGDDLGQLLIGHSHDGLLAATELPALHEVLVQSYLVGLATEGLHVNEDAVRLGMDGGLVVRSAFTALPLERLGEPITEELAEHVERRIELTRYLVDVGHGATTQRDALVA